MSMLAASLSAHFTMLDWAVMVGYLALVSVLGVLLAGKQKSMEDFFGGGGRLPWYAVSASIMATIISAVTFVGVPSIAFGGNMTYLQLGIIAGLISRLFVAFVLVPAYFQRRIYSPYDYMGNQLGPEAKHVTTALFSLGGLLAQSARVFLTAMVLQIIMADQLDSLAQSTGIPAMAWSIILIGIISVVWTMLGGIATVIWTDAMLFVIFLVGGIVALLIVIGKLPEGLSQFIEIGSDNNKFQIFSLSVSEAFDFTKPYTLVAAGFAVVIGNLGAYGTDQLLAQRIFACRSQRDAKLAMLSSYAAEFVALLMLLVGVGLFVFYTQFPEKLSGDAAIAVAKESDKIFPVFILQQIPAGATGLIIAGIFAAAISSLTSILAALAQTTVSSIYLPRRARKLGIDASDETALANASPEEGRRIVTVSRWMVVFWGVALCLMALVVGAYKDASAIPILDLALGLASYVVGGLFAAFVLAWLPLNVNGYGLVYAAPLGVLSVLAAAFHEPWAIWTVGVLSGTLVVFWVVAAIKTRDPELRIKRLARTPLLVLGAAMVTVISWQGYFHQYDAQGAVVTVAPPMIDPDTRKPMLDLAAEPTYLKHPITKEVLLDSNGQRVVDEKAWPKVRDESKRAPVKVNIAWPWYAPIGGFTAFLFGWALADYRPRRQATPAGGFPVTPNA